MAAPTYDAVSGANLAGLTALTLTWAHTCTGSDRCLYVLLRIRVNDANAVSGITYNGVALTLLNDTFSTADGAAKTAQVWRLKDPASGANNIVITQTQLKAILATSVSFADVDQTTPEGTEVTDTDLSVAATLTADQNLLSFAVVDDYNAPAAPNFTSTGTAQTERADRGQGLFQMMSVATQTGVGSVTASYTFSQAYDFDDIWAIPVNGIGGSATTGNRTILTPFGPSRTILSLTGGSPRILR